MRFWVLLTLLLLIVTTTFAAEFSTPESAPKILGGWQEITIGNGDSLGRLSKRYDVSIHNVKLHNPRLLHTKYIHPGEKLVMPSCYWLPQAVKPGEILINLATQTLFFRPQDDSSKLYVYPVTVGKAAHPTPTGEFYIKKKKENPIWYPTVSVRVAYAKRGKSLPFAVEGGDHNPLGAYAMYLNKPTYLIHTAVNIQALGGKQSFGCVRMYKKDIARLYQQVPVKTKVSIVDINYPEQDKLYNICAKSI